MNLKTKIEADVIESSRIWFEGLNAKVLLAFKMKCNYVTKSM